VVLAGEAGDVPDVAEDLGGEQDAEAVVVGQGAGGAGEGVAGMGGVVAEPGVDAPQVGEQVAAAGVVAVGVRTVRSRWRPWSRTGREVLRWG
jgi:hypothetical protein